MSEHFLAPPRGMRDFYPPDMAVRNRIFDAWREAAEAYGFLPYDACVVESLELFKRKSGEEIVQQIYAFEDKSGRPLALRPEMTPTLARMVAARKGAWSLPIKWYTIAQCFRYERMTKGRKREHYQWNLDILGEPSVSAEVETIGAAVHALKRLGLSPNEIRVHFSSRALLSGLLEQLGIPPVHHASVFLALDKRGKLSDEALRELLRGAGVEEPTVGAVFRLFELGTLEEAVALLEGGGPTATGDALREFTELARAAGLEEWLVFDLSVIRGLSYYTGIVFEAFDTKRSLRAVLGGGRYDNLLAAMGGDPLPGVGLGFGDVVIAELLKSLGSAPSPPAADLAVGFMQKAQQAAALRLAARFRAEGTRVDLALKPEKPRAFFSRVGKSGIPRAAYLGPDDTAAGTVRIKDMATRQETVIPIGADSGPSHLRR